MKHRFRCVFFVIVLQATWCTATMMSREALPHRHQEKLQKYLLQDSNIQQKLDNLFADEEKVKLFTDPNIPLILRTTLLKQHGFIFSENRPHICIHKSIPEVVIKGPAVNSPNPERNKLFPLKQSINLHRVIYADCIRSTIKKYCLEDLLGVPTKYWYHIPSHSWEMHDENYLVISEFVHLRDIGRYEISDEHVRAILIIIYECGLIETRPEHIWFCENSDRILIVDTEPRALNDERCALCDPLEWNQLREEEIRTSLRIFMDYCDHPLLEKIALKPLEAWPSILGLDTF